MLNILIVWIEYIVVVDEVCPVDPAVVEPQYPSMPRLVEGITPRKGLMAPQNNFLDKIAKRFKGTRKFMQK